MSEMKVSELLERMATIMAEQGHYMAGRDKWGAGPVCLYWASGVAWRDMHVVSAEDDIWMGVDVYVGNRMEDWILRAGAPVSRDHLIQWSDNTADEDVILTIKRAAELAREAGE